MAGIDEILATGMGNALSQGAHAGYFVAHGAQVGAEERRRQAVQPDIAPAMKGDMDAFGRVAAGDPRTASVVAQALDRMDVHQRAKVKEAADFTTRAGMGILQADPAARPQLYDAAKSEYAASGGDVSKWPQTYDENWTKFNVGKAVDATHYFTEMEKDKRKAAKGTGGGAAPDLEPMSTPGVRMPSAPPPPGQPAPKIMGRPSADAAPPGAGPVIAAAGPPAGMPPGNTVASMGVPGSTLAPPGAPMDVSPGVQTADNSFGTPPQAVAAAAPPVVAPPVQTAQAPPLGPQGGPIGGGEPRADGSGTPLPPAAAPKGQQGSVWTVDPTTQGFVMMGHRTKPGQPMMPAEISGHFIYRNPQTGETVLYKPRAEPNLPQGYETNPDEPGALRPIKGGPHDKGSTGIIPPEMADVHGEDFLKTQPQETQNVVRGLVDGSLLLQDLSKRSQDYSRYLALAKQTDPNFDPSPGGARRRFETQAMVNGADGQTISAANTALQHMKTYHDLIRAMNNGDVTLINSVVNAVKRQFGNADIPSAEAARNLLATEVAKAARGAGALNEGEEKRAINDLSLSAAPAAQQKVLATLTELMNGRIHTVEDKARRLGVPDSRIEGYISPRAKEALDYVQKNPLDAPKGGEGGKAPIKVKSPDEAKRLAPGTEYMTPDGNVYRRK